VILGWQLTVVEFYLQLQTSGGVKVHHLLDLLVRVTSAVIPMAWFNVVRTMGYFVGEIMPRAPFALELDQVAVMLVVPTGRAEATLWEKAAKLDPQSNASLI
jgi:hypothetical protein